MGAKQSGPAAANGRARAYSGSDLPSSSGGGGANGTAGGGAGGGGGGARASAAGRFPAQVPGAHQPSASGGAAAASAAPRSRSLGGAVGTVASGARAAQSSFSIPNSSSGPYGSQDSVHSSPEDGGSGGRDRPAGGGPGGPRLVIGSLPAHLSPHLFGGTAPSLPAPGSGLPAPGSGGRHVGRGRAAAPPSPPSPPSSAARAQGAAARPGAGRSASEPPAPLALLLGFGVERRVHAHLLGTPHSRKSLFCARGEWSRSCFQTHRRGRACGFD
ncbi:E3 ubiquitin-protein ligase ZNRF2 [Galemys pyrenaicus]|uniref:RING-type E3 ubiquitin transferase n=1 Tax=Galemys pyrenaicus TaxID=202257 RepID=A0A8J6DNZ2_GALPY|nr:E3 ubiquitin-protein ligase ZNRF2 [Galemys pyrenaicus]